MGRGTNAKQVVDTEPVIEKSESESERTVYNDGYMPKKDYVRVNYVQPHWTRRKAIRSAHPEIKELQHQDPLSALWVIISLAAMTWLSYMVKDFGAIALFMMSYVFGATMLHAMWVLIHELTHDLVFKNGTLNTAFLLLCNMPHVFPSAVSFRHFHRQHHGHLNETYSDPDVPSPIENTVFGNSPLGKAVWLCLFSIMQGLRVLRHHATPLAPRLDCASVLNVVLNVAYTYAIFYMWGARAVIFLALSSLMAVGLFLHPFGARWIAEHYAVYPDQETYSYYGALNKLMFNIGYHNEHHDFPTVPWNKLPVVKRISPEYYEPLYQHKSYLRVLWEFIFNDDFTLCSRVVRWPRGGPVGEKLD